MVRSQMDSRQMRGPTSNAGNGVNNSLVYKELGGCYVSQLSRFSH